MSTGGEGYVDLHLRGRVLDERNALLALVDGRNGYPRRVSDTGYDFPREQGEFTYEVDGHRYEVTVKELADGLPVRGGEVHCPGCEGGYTGAGPCHGAGS